jgi:tetratricopeptide (TPR) repeat protein
MGWLVALASLVLAAPAVAADLDDLPPEVREKTQPVHLNWSKQLNRTLDGALRLKGVQLPGRPHGGTGARVEAVHLEGLQAPAEPPVAEVSAARVLGDARVTLAIESAKTGSLQAGELAAVMRECEWMPEDAASFWQQLDRETSGRARQPDVASQVLAAIEQTRHLGDAYGEDASSEALFGLAQVKLYAGKLSEARALLGTLLSRLKAGDEPKGSLSKGLIAYRMGESYRFERDWVNAREWFLKPDEWGPPTRPEAYDARGEALVEAARACRVLDDQQQALDLYRKAIGMSGWGQAVAAAELSMLLDKAGEHVEARAVLDEVASSRTLSPMETVLVLRCIGMSRYAEGRAGAARRAFEECAATYEAIPSQQQRYRAEPIAAGAYHMLDLLDRWQAAPLYASTSSVRIDAAVGQASLERTFHVETWHPQPLTVKADLPYVEVREIGVTRDEEVTRTEYAVRTLPDAPAGELSGALTIASESFPGKIAFVRLVGSIAAALHCIPTSAHFGFMAPRDSKQLPIRILSTSGKAFTVRQVTIPDAPAVNVSEPTRVTDSEWRVTVSLTTVGPGTVDTSLMLHTDVPGAETIQVPVYAHVRAPE